MTSARPRVRAFIRIFERSSSLAAHVDTDEGEYVIKVGNNPEGPRVLVNEWVGTSLARMLGVATPDFAVVEVPPSIEIPLRPGLVADPGPAFGSRFERGQTWGGKSSLQAIGNPEMISKLIVLDTWLLNVDRYSVGADLRVRSNPGNLWLSEENAPPGKFLLKAIDQGHLFSGPSWRAQTLRAIDRVRDREIYGRFPEFSGAITRTEVAATLAAATAVDGGKLHTMLEKVPRQWGLRADEAEAIDNFLRQRIRYLSDELHGILWPQGEFGW